MLSFQVHLSNLREISFRSEQFSAPILPTDFTVDPIFCFHRSQLIRLRSADDAAKGGNRRLLSLGAGSESLYVLFRVSVKRRHIPP